MTQSVYFSDLKAGDKVKVTGFQFGDNKCYLRKLLAMGVVKGAELEVKRLAPLGDPVVVVIKGVELSLRKAEAQGLVLQPVGLAVC